MHLANTDCCGVKYFHGMNEAAWTPQKFIGYLAFYWEHRRIRGAHYFCTWRFTRTTNENRMMDLAEYIQEHELGGFLGTIHAHNPQYAASGHHKIIAGTYTPNVKEMLAHGKTTPEYKRLARNNETNWRWL